MLWNLIKALLLKLIADADSIRAVLKTVAANLAEAAAATETKIDDLAAAALSAIVNNDEAYELFYALVMDLFGLGLDLTDDETLKAKIAADPRVVKIGEKVGIGTLGIVAIVALALRFLRDGRAKLD